MESNSAACELGAKANLIDAGVASQVRVDVALCARRAVETRSTHKVCAASAGYEPDYWARVLTGERGILLERLGQLPVAVQREFVIRWAGLLGLQIERKDAAAKRVALAKFVEAGQALAEIL